MKLRLQKLQKSIELQKLDFLLLDSAANRNYLTGFTGSTGFVLVPRQGRTSLYVDSRYTLQAKKQTQNLKVTEFENFFRDNLVAFAKANKGARIGFESKQVSHEKLNKLKSFGKDLKWIPTKNLVEDFRVVKDEVEVKKIKKALNVVDHAFVEIKKFISVGQSEREIAFKLEMIMRGLGADKSSWEPLIVATGKNSALPHHGHSNSKIKKGDTIQLDYGCVIAGYYTDTSRVLFMGRPTTKQVAVYDQVLRAQMLGISLVKSGVASGQVDEKVKEFLRKSTQGVYKHGLGHGVGLEIHEAPTLYTGNKEKLQAGQVITIEPGVYIEGWGGMRLEDMVLVTSSGYEVLTKATKKLEEIII